MKFSEVIGQQAMGAYLRRLADTGRLPHAIMLCGATGEGKLALATAFGCYLLGTTEELDPPMLAKLEHPDLHFTFPTIKLPSMGADHKPVSDDFAHEWQQLVHKGLYFSLNQWLSAMGADNQQAVITAGESEELVRKLSLKSSQGGRKVSIIWLPELMNESCANKLLKLLEEPPQQTVFILVSEEPGLLLETIRSRVQRIDVKPISEDDLCQALIQRRALDQATAARVARVARGSWLKAVEELQADSEAAQFFALYVELMRMAYQRRIKDLKKWSEKLAAMGREAQKRFLVYFLRMARENFAYNFGNPELVYLTAREEEFAQKFARFIHEGNIIQINELGNRALRDIGQNASAKIVFFDIALQMIMLLLPQK